MGIGACQGRARQRADAAECKEVVVAAPCCMSTLESQRFKQSYWGCYDVDWHLERDKDYPIDVIMAGLTLARHASEGAEGQPDYFLKPDVAQLQVPIFSRFPACDILNPFALRGRCTHIPRSEGVPVSVATVSPKDSETSGSLRKGPEMLSTSWEFRVLALSQPPRPFLPHPVPIVGLLGALQAGRRHRICNNNIDTLNRYSQ
ncbi:hypothetical protein Tco_1109933 [Tanacetum coccineum]|uniref:Uncharacterized protein n=1 Tax=Tanacetum coccineum TaxID=301880 RepID=A0ABQ5IHD4_9ASTR